MTAIVLDPFSHVFHEDPYPTYRALRDTAPCYAHPDGWFALSRYDDVVDASQRPLLFSSAKGTSLEFLDASTMLPMMIFMDPPRHDAHRKLVGRAFTPRAVSDVETYARSVAAACLDALRDKGGGDVVEEFTAILPMNVIMELLGVPAADRNQVRHWIDATLERLEAPPYVPDSAIEAMQSVSAYWFALVADKRRSADDGTLMSRLCRVEIDGIGLSDAEVVGFCSLIGAAGTETLTKLLANAIVLFDRNPGEWQKVLDDPGVVPSAVEEVLRYWAPSQYQGRVLTDDVTYHDVTMPAGARVLLLTASANRDDREYDDPDRFDVTRPSHVPIGFGHGLHFCLGAALARLEGRVGLEEFAARFPRYEVDEANVRRVHMSNVHGFASVPIAVAS